ncbi:hypothetical protein ABW20_dc0102490 [Dactylellina cionopaga]|nr:hypothetical protein ABW20_dc0102490 [Dactylellina cionopaga]
MVSTLLNQKLGNGHIRVMVQYFSSLSDQIKLLSEKCNAEFRELVLEGEGSEDENVKELLDYAQQIKAFALVVNLMARTYANVSQNEIFQGFQLISNLSNRDPMLLSPKEHIERSIGDLTLYQHNAQAGISACVYENKVRFFAECKKIYPTLTDASPLNPANK